jgi:hypothetical protein
MINHSVLLHLWCLSGVRKKMQQFTSSWWEMDSYNSTDGCLLSSLNNGSV